LSASIMASESVRKGRQTNKKKEVHLGPAPDDIYDLEKEIQIIRQEDKINELRQQFASLQEDEKSQPVLCRNINDAKRALQRGKTIKYMFSEHVTASDIVEVAQALGIKTHKIKHVLGSSKVAKKLIESYVQNVATADEDYTGYLRYCTEVTPLRCEENEITPQFRIRMDLDYNTYVNGDDEFAFKFGQELAQQVFKNDKVEIVAVREGSVIAVVTICVVALALAGIINISIDLFSGNKEDVLIYGEEHDWDLGQRVHDSKKRVSGVVVAPVMLDKNNQKVVRVRFDDASEAEYALNDMRLQPLEPGYDPSIDASVHIVQDGAYIEARRIQGKQRHKKRQSWFW